MTRRRRPDPWPGRFRRDLVDHGHKPEGPQWRFRFPNNFGASVIRHDTGDRAGLWEVALLRWDGGQCRSAATIPGSAQIPVFYHTTEDAVSGQIETLRLAPPPTDTYVDVLVITDTGGSA